MPYAVNPDPQPVPLPKARYRGWAWRGAHLDIAQLAAYAPDLELKHLGEARACLGPLTSHPVVFRIYAHRAWRSSRTPVEIIFPEHSIFRVRRICNLGDSRMCILLEQCVEGYRWYESLQHEFDAWLPVVAKVSPQPDPAQVKAWEAPFARWAVNAVEGDEPLSGVFYEAEAAVQFTSAWTGLHEGVVRKALDAKARYLELAGIIDGEVDEALMREREAMGHLLPETPGVIGEGEIEYLLQATGLDEDILHRINEGETAYMDSLGLVGWDDDEERDEHLGAPELKETPDTVDGREAPSLHPAHGDSWACIFQDIQTAMAEHIPQTVVQGRLAGSFPAPSLDFTQIHALHKPSGPQLETICLMGDIADRKVLVAAFPVILDGNPHTVEILHVQPCNGGADAVIEARTLFGACLGFFAPSYFADPSIFKIGGVLDLRFAAFAYKLKAAPPQVFQIVDEGAIRVIQASHPEHLAFSPKEIDDLGLIEIRSEDVAFLFPHSTINLDEFEFEGPVESVETVSAWGQTFYRLEIIVMRDACSEDAHPFTIPIYVAEHNLADGYRPCVGDDVMGMLWLQGMNAQ